MLVVKPRLPYAVIAKSEVFAYAAVKIVRRSKQQKGGLQ